MGLYTFLFNHARFYEMYQKNCSAKTPEYWYSVAGPASAPLGSFYAGIGIVSEIIYIPFLLAMLKKDFFQHSCYKIMFLIGLFDVLVAIPCTAIITGFQAIFDAHLCTNLPFYFVVGSLATACWYGVSLTCVILAIDRFLEMCWPKMAAIFFGGLRVYFWMSIGVFYFFYTLFTQVPFLYNTTRYLFMKDPYAEIEGMKGDPVFFNLTFHCIHNLSVPFLLGGIYFGMLVVIKVKSMITSTSNITQIQKLLTYQAICICFEMFGVSLVYVYNMYYLLPNIIEIIAEIGLVCIHGDTPIVYLILNQSLRNEVFKMVPWLERFRKVHDGSRYSAQNDSNAKNSAI